MFGLWLCLLAVSCAGHGYEYTVFIDPKFVENSTTDVVFDALYDWEAKVPVTFRTIVSKCSGLTDRVICVHYSSHAYFLKRFPGKDYIGVTDVNAVTDGGEVWIAMDVGNPQTTFAHEAGHAMGLEHHVGAYLMDPTQNPNITGVTPDDAEQWQSLR